jgi:NAD(P)-dependent dehydrogenase (short-subunit alcohol dehydrogenase family)
METPISDSPLKGSVAVVTGTSSGVGQAIALALAREGAHICAIGRNARTLADTVAASDKFATATAFRMDLTIEESFQILLRHLEEDCGRVDILVHSAGLIQQAPMNRARIADFDNQYSINVRVAPYLLSQRLPSLFVGHREDCFHKLERRSSRLLEN